MDSVGITTNVQNNKGFHSYIHHINVFKCQPKKSAIKAHGHVQPFLQLTDPFSACVKGKPHSSKVLSVSGELAKAAWCVSSRNVEVSGFRKKCIQRNR